MLIFATCCTVVTIGCQSPPRGDSFGRIPVHTDTEAERGGQGGMMISDLLSASDTVAMALASDIVRLAQEDFDRYRVSVMWGDIENKTGVMPTSDIEMVRRRIKDKLTNSRLFRDNIKFVAGLSQMNRLNDREYGRGSEDLLDEGREGGVRIQRASPEYTFYLNGQAYRIGRGGTNLYYLSFTLVRASDGEEVFSRQYEMKYSR